LKVERQFAEIVSADEALQHRPLLHGRLVRVLAAYVSVSLGCSFSDLMLLLS
jgi:hypothetical protein